MLDDFEKCLVLFSYVGVSGIATRLSVVYFLSQHVSIHFV